MDWGWLAWPFGATIVNLFVFEVCVCKLEAKEQTFRRQTVYGVVFFANLFAPVVVWLATLLYGISILY